MSIEDGRNVPGGTAAGYQAIQTLLPNLSNPKFLRDALEQVYRDSLLGGIYAGSENLRITGALPASGDIHTGVSIALIAIDLCQASTTHGSSVPDFMPVPDDLDAEQSESISPPHPGDETLYNAGVTVIQGIVSDALTIPGAFRGRLNTAFENPLYKGISDGFRTLMPRMLAGGVHEQRVADIHNGLHLALMAASAPYEMLSAYAVPEPSDFA